MNRRLVWTMTVTSIAGFMVALDNLVVTNALPSIRRDLGAPLTGLEWTVNAYTLTFAVLLLPAAAVGDRLGRRRVLAGGLVLFTLASAAAALAPGIGVLVVARTAQGAGAAAVLPLSVTVLSSSVPAARRGAALGVWGAVSGAAVALGPLVGGAITDTFSWQWIFWLNVPTGLVLVPLTLRRLPETTGPATPFDLPGVALVTAGLFGVVLGLVRASDLGWSSPPVLTPIGLGGGLLAGFVAWERRTPTPVLPMRLFRTRTFAVTNTIAMIMSFGMFGSIFLLAQFLQTAQGLSPLQAGIRTLPWTGMPMLIAPVAGRLADRLGGRPLLIIGLALQAVALGRIALSATAHVAYASLVIPFLLGGIGMSLFFVPLATVVLNNVPPQLQGVASGTNNAIREVGGVFGTAVLAAIFSNSGGFATAEKFTAGARPAVLVGAIVVAIGAVLALALPHGHSRPDPPLDPDLGRAAEGLPHAEQVTGVTSAWPRTTEPTDRVVLLLTDDTPLTDDLLDTDAKTRQQRITQIQ